MSLGRFSRSVDLQQLVEDGYEVEICGTYLLVHNVPYVNASKQINFGLLVSPLTLANDVTIKPDNHQVLWVGEFPCDKEGARLKLGNGANNTKIREGVVTSYIFSQKIRNEGYNDYYEKMTTYVKIFQHEAQAIDPAATAETHKVVRLTEQESVFRYSDNASSRAGITAINEKLKRKRVAIVGLGGTGSYVLDLVAKTCVEEIHLFDGDTFYQHNAFRSPGAPSAEELEKKLPKVEWFAAIYSKLHWNIKAHSYHLDESNLQELMPMDFVFVCVEGEARRSIIDYLVSNNLSFIDVGMGLYAIENESLGGQLRVTTVTPLFHDHLDRTISYVTDEVNEYSQNIQIADMNALNAAFAVIKWKKLWGFYLDFQKEHNTVYSISTNLVVNDETQE
jgi:tRNA A37 threonylcarbamoyladenosine dehydratase